MDSMSQNMTSNRLHEWNDRQGNWGTGGATGPPPGAGHDSGIHTRDSSAAPSVMSSAYSAFSGSNYSESHQVDWARYGNLSRKEEEISAIKSQMESQLTALKSHEDVEAALRLIKTFLFDNDMRCTHMASKALHDLVKRAQNDQFLGLIQQNHQFWQSVLQALDKTEIDVIAKELTRVIYILTSKESDQGRLWCSLICNCDGLRVLIKMLDASVDTVVYCSITSIHNIIGKLSVNEREGNPNPKAPILATFIEKNGVVVVAKKMHDRFQQMRSNNQTKVILN